MKKFLAILILGLLWCNVGFALGGDGLKGLKLIDLVIEKTNNCGVTNNDIEKEVRYVLSNSKIKLKKDINIESLWIAPNIIKSTNRCSGSIYFEVSKIGYLVNSAGVKYVGREVLYSKGHLVIDNASDFKNSFLQRIELMTKDLVILWTEVN